MRLHSNVRIVGIIRIQRNVSEEGASWHIIKQCRSRHRSRDTPNLVPQPRLFDQDEAESGGALFFPGSIWQPALGAFSYSFVVFRFSIEKANLYFNEKEICSHSFLSLVHQWCACACRSFASSPVAFSSSATRRGPVSISRFESETPLPYGRIQQNLEIVKRHLTRPLTLTGDLRPPSMNAHMALDLCTHCQDSVFPFEMTSPARPSAPSSPLCIAALTTSLHFPSLPSSLVLDSSALRHLASPSSPGPGGSSAPSTSPSLSPLPRSHSLALR